MTVVIITIMSAIALPNLRQAARDRRTRLAAEEIARVYREARLRAMGRGSAVTVRYNAASRSFEVREAVTGTSAALPATPAACARLPASSCQLADWGKGVDTFRGVQTLETLQLDEATEKTGIKVKLEFNGAAVENFTVCFTPLGRSFFTNTTWPPTTISTPLTQVPLVRVYRTEPNDTVAIGLERRVVILPNGQARMQTAGST